MKKIYLIILIFISSFLLTACGDNSVRLFIPGEYFATDLIAEFKKSTGKNLKITNFFSNEAAITKIKSGEKFDIIIPSDYAIEQLVEERRVQKIDWSRVNFSELGYEESNLNKDNFFADSFLNLKSKYGEIDYDFLDYGVPYFWGNVGLIYNKDKVDPVDLDTDWNILKRSDKYKIALYDSSRDGFMVALKASNLSANTKSKQEIEIAKKWLYEIKQNKNQKYKTEFITDEIFDAMENGEFDIAMSYSGDAVEIMFRLIESTNNINLSYYVPKKGTNVWFDAMIIPNDANLESAYSFINFILNKENATKNADEISYSSPIKKIFSEQLAYYIPPEDKTSPEYEEYINTLKEEYKVEGKELDKIVSIYSEIGHTLDIKVLKNDEVFRYIIESKILTEREWDVFRCL